MTKFDRSQVEKILLGLVQLNPYLWKARSHFTHHPRQLIFYTSPISYASSVIWTHVYPELTRGNDSEKKTHIFSARDLVFMVSVTPGIGNLWHTCYYPHVTGEVTHVSNHQVTSQTHTATRNGARMIILSLVTLPTTSCRILVSTAAVGKTPGAVVQRCKDVHGFQMVECISVPRYKCGNILWTYTLRFSFLKWIFALFTWGIVTRGWWGPLTFRLNCRGGWRRGRKSA